MRRSILSVGAMEARGRESQDAKSLEHDLTRRTFIFLKHVCLEAEAYLHGLQCMCARSPYGLVGC